MNIAHFLIGRCNPDNANGVEKAVYYLTLYQASLGHKVVLHSLTSKEPFPIPNVDVKAHPPRRVRFSLPQSLFYEIEQMNPDVVHLHSVYIPENVTLARWLRSKGIPYVTTPHGGLSRKVLFRKFYVKLPFKYLFESYFHNQAAFVHAVADQEDIRKYGVRAPIVSAPNGFDFSLIPPAPDPSLFFDRFPEAQRRRVIMFLGRLDPLHKGLDLLIKAFAQAQLENTVLVLVGPDWNNSAAKLKRLTKQVNCESSVLFAGPAYGPDKYHFLAAAEIFAHPSRWEGVPFSVLEAAASAKPCLVTRPADPQRLLEKHNAGIIVAPTVTGIVEGLRKFNEMSFIDLESMGRRARNVVKNELSWEQSARILVEAYQKYVINRA